MNINQFIQTNGEKKLQLYNISIARLGASIMIKHLCFQLGSSVISPCPKSSSLQIICAWQGIFF